MNDYINERKSVSELKKLEYVIINESRQVFLSEKERNSNPFARGAAGTMADFCHGRQGAL